MSNWAWIFLAGRVAMRRRRAVRVRFWLGFVRMVVWAPYPVTIVLKSSK
jgi:hypothetical protein